MASGAQVCVCNRYGQTPLDKAKPHLRQLLQGQRSFVGILTPQQLISCEKKITVSASQFFCVCVLLPLLLEKAEKMGQSMTKVPYKETFWKGTMRTRPRE